MKEVGEGTLNSELLDGYAAEDLALEVVRVLLGEVERLGKRLIGLNHSNRHRIAT